MRLQLSALLVSLSAALPAQTTWIVDANGGGNFTDLGSAVFAATAGDTVVVRAGTYPAAGINKGLQVLADPGVTVVGGIGSALLVGSIPANESVTIRGFNMTTGLGSDVLSIGACQGPVHVEDMDLAFGVAIGESAAVTFYDVHTSAGALSVRNSNVVAVQCSFRGRGNLFRKFAVEVNGTSRVAFASCQLVGADAVASPGVGLMLNAGTVVLGGYQNSVAAGTDPSGSATPTPAITLLAGATAILDPDVILLPSSGGNPVVGDGQVIDQRVPSLQANMLAGTLSSTLHAPGALQSYLVLSLIPPAVLPTPFGDLWISPVHVVLNVSNVPASGLVMHQASLPGAPAGFTALLQSVVVQPTGLQLSLPVALTLDH